ncbi:MAG TPA: divergent PAP2 family protein [Halanaerobiaceae bacterium]|jgi:acid phosphatase family membrane protein YuiD|nr:divergent PAP2 family protein [Bacillota bacterium]HHU92542.1 divergent PAP2 family protein [Halanaerobiaceae bacterium]HOA41758.1 divergent PAP2 family protein [Halanaerobiales bacterium]HPZ63900.1 divergent PAP2 family protein [Halanaerobiales bacterium]HQD05076.1 divergent PAP2 family protein [Halanaerobiales bacterium]
MNILEISLLSLFITQVIKIFTVYPFNFSRVIGSGGMPSSHAAFVSTLSTSIGLRYGFKSDLFAVVAVFSLIIIYDAGGVRRAVGEQANVLNKIIRNLDPKHFYKSTDKEIIIKDLKELIGHTPVEVLVGTFLGILFALLNHFYF